MSLRDQEDLFEVPPVPVSNEPIYGQATSVPISQTFSSFAYTLDSSNLNLVASQVAHDLLELRGSALTAKTLSANTNYLNSIEETILRSTEPVQLNESEEITVLGQRGIWANKHEVLNWKGLIPISEYEINQDPNPEVITKRTLQQLEYIQELAVRYLRPPTPPAPGEIIINQQPNVLTPPAPPLIIRQQPVRPATPEPLVIREAPPEPPAQVGRKVITISGKRLPPPPRKVIIERLAQLPSKPQSVLIERWLPYAQVKRRVIFNRPSQADPVVVRPRNVIVQWEAPRVNLRKEYKYLGVVKANPVEYVQRYGSALTRSSELPQFVLDIKSPEGIVLAAEHRYNNMHELYGDVSALKLIDLEKEGLSEYRSYLEGGEVRVQSNELYGSLSNELDIVEQIFRSVDQDQNGRISVGEAEKILLRLNSRLGRRYGEDDVKALFNTLDSDNDGSLDLQEFRKAFLSLGL